MCHLLDGPHEDAGALRHEGGEFGKVLPEIIGVSGNKTPAVGGERADQDIGQRTPRESTGTSEGNVLAGGVIMSTN